MGAREHYVEAFAAGRSRLAGAALPWLRAAREAAIERFAEQGLPTTRHEDWKYTSVAALDRRLFRLADDTAPAGAARVAHLALDGSHLLVFVNGRHAPALSRLAGLPREALASNLGAVVAERPAWLEAWFGDELEREGNGFSALNAALWSDGACIELPPGMRIEQPIHVLHVTTVPTAASEPAAFPRHLIRLGAGAHATVVEHYVGDDTTAYLTDAVTRIELGAGAALTHARVQQEGARAFHIGEVRVEQGRDSRLRSQAFAFGGQLARVAIATRLGAEGCAAELIGLYVGRGRQHLDHHTRIDHACPHGTSREFYKGVLDDASRAVFSGRVVVHRDAQRSDAQQANHNLLLSDTAEVDTKPQLEIWADDVKCSHGATVGQLDPDQRHYLRTRGLDDASARALLIHAFAAEVLARVDLAPLRERLEALLRARLPGKLEDSTCEPQATN